MNRFHILVNIKSKTRKKPFFIFIQFTYSFLHTLALLVTPVFFCDSVKISIQAAGALTTLVTKGYGIPHTVLVDC